MFLVNFFNGCLVGGDLPSKSGIISVDLSVDSQFYPLYDWRVFFFFLFAGGRKILTFPV